MAKNTSKTPAKAAKPALLAGGNPQIAKAYGDAPVQAYTTTMPGWNLDALITCTVPGVHKAVKWNSPLYGIEGQGRFPASIASRNTSRWPSSVARPYTLSRPASPSRRKCVTSTSTRMINLMKRNSPTG